MTTDEFFKIGAAPVALYLFLQMKCKQYGGAYQHSIRELMADLHCGQTKLMKAIDILVEEQLIWKFSSWTTENGKPKKTRTTFRIREQIDYIW